MVRDFLILQLTGEIMFEKIFKIKHHNTNVRTELIAGLTTFMTMAYILALNPLVMEKAGMSPSAVFTTTAIAAIIGTLIMAFYANLPIGLAPGVAASAFFAFTIVIAMGHTWQFALTAVLFEGIIFVLLTACKIREMIIDAIPDCMKNAISCGIGLFIAFIGFTNAGIVKQGAGTPMTLGNFHAIPTVLALLGIVITGVLLVKRVKGALLIAIIIIALIGIPLGITHVPKASSLLSLPPSIKPIFFQFQFHDIFTVNMLITVITLLFMELFDTIGTLLGLATKAGLLDKNGKLPNIKQALFADAYGTTAASVLGTCTVTAYVESAAGVAEGGKTGLTAFVIAVCFIISLFISNIFLAIPSIATAPILIIVGVFMLSPIKDLNFNDFSESIPCFLTLIIMPLSYSISDGIVIGMISYVLIKLLSGKWRDLNWFIIILTALFALKLIEL